MKDKGPKRQFKATGKNWGLYSAPCWRNRVSNFEKKDIFWNNIPPGKLDPYMG